MKTDLIIAGGGAAGFFAALQCKLIDNQLDIIILEQGKEVLQKVKISGGGRCNVTNSIWDADELIKNYPRGAKEMRGPFHKFGCGDTMAWFESLGVKLKIEEDGRVFPVSDDSATIVDCLNLGARSRGVKVVNGSKIRHISLEDGRYIVQTQQQEYESSSLLMCTGSNPSAWHLLEELGYQMVEPQPSLFTFHIKDKVLHELMGLSVPHARVNCPAFSLSDEGPLLITHWGFSGPAVLRLSAFGARKFAAVEYRFDIEVNWGFDNSANDIKKQRQEAGARQVSSYPLGGLPARLWKFLVSRSDISEEMRWADLDRNHIEALIKILERCPFAVTGKSTFKEEFVTAGGVDLKQINFSTFESKRHAGLFFAGEILDIDAVTGGFNFQAAWTGAYLAAKAITTRHKNK
ncbi:MAG: NAD(P)/FAD-dependent oxidoreductase [Saprospiraceae bacterium]|nr:NAD(P)/FAD-dependent oxidoreductase [Saprospiraceae bacterium]